MGGTRYNSRGINDEGHVSNFVETELIVMSATSICSYLCVRGSVPTFWSQVGMNQPIRITRSVELSTKAFMKHAHQLSNTYGKISVVDLMSPGKPYEQ